MRAPDFWAESQGMVPCLLAPLGTLWHLAGQVRHLTVRPWHAPVPVLCVGNLVVGGAGKTPLARALAAVLRERGRAAHLLSRGYRGTLRGPVRVDPDRHGADEVGDEALLLAGDGPAWIAHDRRAGAWAAAAAGAEVIVMDDGFQNPALAKDLSLLAVDGGYGFGNGLLIPAGPLREPVERGLARAAGAVLIGDDAFGLADRLVDHVPVLRARLVPDKAATELRDRAVIAFAGIGRPAKFDQTLAEIGCDVVGRWHFADHHPYTADEIMELCETAQARGAVPVTTAKDAVRLPAGARAMVTVVNVSLVFERPAALVNLLGPILD